MCAESDISPGLGTCATAETAQRQQTTVHKKYEEQK